MTVRALITIQELSDGAIMFLVKVDQKTGSENLRLQYAGVIGLLCECSLKLRPGSESEEMRDNIERAVEDFCKLTGWTYQRVLHRIEVFPPKACDGSSCVFENSCDALSNEGKTKLACTLPKGHVGYHIACSILKHNIRTWP